MDSVSKDLFELPYKNPFQKEGETRAQFIHRCNRSMIAFKKWTQKALDSGVLLHQENGKKRYGKI